MLIKVDNKIYDSSLTPIYLVVSDEEKEILKRLPSEISILCFYPQATLH